MVAALATAACGGDGVPAPVDETNRWTLVDPADEGMDAAKLAAADRHAREEIETMTSLLVARHGRLVFERYYNGWGASDAFLVYSITKSVTSTLVGIALRDGKLRGLGRPAAAYFPGEARTNGDVRVRRITLRQLLTMTAGWVITGGLGGGGEEVLAATHPIREAFERPLEAVPGSRFGYDNGASHLLGAVINEATGTPLAEYAGRELFGPLGIAKPYWQEDAEGRAIGAAGLSLHARDMLKLGQLYLQRGRWGDRQLVPQWYVQDATRAHVDVTGEGEGYGYQWWVTDGFRPGDPAGFAAIGYGGQAIYVVPSLDLVVAITQTPTSLAGLDGAQLVYDFVVPAVHDR